MREVPVELPSLTEYRAGLERALLDPGDRDDFRVIASRENLVRRLEIMVAQGRFNDFVSSSAQQRDHSLPGNPGQEGSVGNRGRHDTSLDHEKVRGSELRHVTQDIAYDGIIKPT